MSGFRALLLVLTAAWLAAASVHASIPTGKGRFVHVWSGKNVPVWTYRPAAAAADAPVVFVCHGTGRNAEFYRDNWVSQAEHRGFIVITPEFTEAAFPGSSGYNLGGMVTGAGAPLPQAQWSFNVIESVFDAVRASLGPAARNTYRLYGHSAGAQFVHRFLLFQPAARVERAVAANAGWYTVPELTTAFPFGLAGGAYSLDLLQERLAGPHVILLGTEDNDPNDPDLSHSAGAEAQGPHRLARGAYFHARATLAAPGLGAEFAWELAYAPGIGHSNAGMAPYASAALFHAPVYLPETDPVDEPASPILTLDQPGYLTTFNHGFTTATAPQDLPWEDDVTVPGWHIYQHALGTPASITAQASVSGTNSGTVYLISHGDNRSNFLLGVRVGDLIGSSTSTPGAGVYFGLRLRNQTGFTVTSVAIAYTGAQFVRSSGTSTSTIQVTRQITASPLPNLLSGTWQALPTLTFSSPFVGTGSGSSIGLNFNDPENRAALGPFSLNGVTWPPGADLWLRWWVPNVSGVDQGVGLDTVSVTITGYAPAAPQIQTQPQGLTVLHGEDVTFAISALGVPAPTYQWRKGAVNLPGETGASLTLARVTAADAGSYSVVVSNASGSVTSQAAVLTVLPNYLAWSEQAGLAGQHAAFTADPDGDGLTNLLEYALGTDPLVAGAAAWRIEAGPDGLVLRFTRAPESVHDTLVEVQTGTDLVNWTTFRTFTAEETGELTVVIPHAGAGPLFARLKVTLLDARPD